MKIHRHSRLAALLALTLALPACDDFIQGPGLTENPNNPTQFTADQLFMAVQARQAMVQQGQHVRVASIWVQQLAGVFNQAKEQGSAYNFTENDVSQSYNHFYLGGGLVDQRKLAALAAAENNPRLQGIALVLEGLTMGTATSLFGDVVYREAVDATVAAPKLDPQEQVYADVQKALDEGIAKLTGAPTTAYPQDLIYGGNSDRWRRAAYTLKARYYLHTAPRAGQAAYQAALAAANQGINEAPTSETQAIHGQAPGDFRFWHGTTLDDGNIWSQFDEARADLAANERFVNVLKARNDPRLAAYFSLASDGQYRGANQFGNPPADGSTAWSRMNRTVRTARPFRQPAVTWMENQLIIAEAQLALGAAGPALAAVNTVRAALNMAPLPGPITLEQIMVEKWIAQYQNVDAYSDYRRTCFPRLKPGGANPASPAASVPFRMPYGNTERLNNPTNIPLPSAAPAKNWNYSTITCPSTGGTL